jgi:hypothetical protein
MPKVYRFCDASQYHVSTPSIVSAIHKNPSTTIAVMFHARTFSLNFAVTAPVAAFARVITIKTTTIKG